MNRRACNALLGGAAAGWPLAARAQQTAMPVVGFLNPGSAAPRAHLVAAFRKGLGDAGFFEGRNVGIEYRWADDQMDRLPTLAADLVRRQVSAIATPGASTVAIAAKRATSSIPIVFAVPDDPVKDGLVASLNRPGGNATGIHYLNIGLAEKRLGLLRDLVPSSSVVAVLVDQHDPNALSATKEVQAAADAIGQRVKIIGVGTDFEIDAAFKSLAANRPSSLLLINSPLFFSQRIQIVTLANYVGLPATFTSREYAQVGGLMSYGTDLADVYHQVGDYTGRVLNGAKPAELPVLQPTKFELLINLKTARALGLTIPDKLLALADEVIE